MTFVDLWKENVTFFCLKEQAAKLEEFEMTKQKRTKKEEQVVEEKTTLHGEGMYRLGLKN